MDALVPDVDFGHDAEQRARGVSNSAPSYNSFRMSCKHMVSPPCGFAHDRLELASILFGNHSYGRKTKFRPNHVYVLCDPSEDHFS